MLRLRTEGIVAAAGASGFVFSDPNLTFSARAQEFFDVATAAPVRNAISHFNACHAMARLFVGGSSNIAWANARFEEYISALENSHPGQSSGFENCPWMVCYKRFSNLLDSSKFNRFRDQMVLWNTTANLNPFTVAGWTPNQQFLNGVCGILIGEEWPGVNSGADNRYAYLRDTWWPQIGEWYWKQGSHEYNSGNYGIFIGTLFDVLARFSTNTNLKNIGRFLRDQLWLQAAHYFALGQFAAANQRAKNEWIGTPRYPDMYAQLLWLMFGGEQPFLLWEGSPKLDNAQGTVIGEFLATTEVASPIPDLIWRINQAAHQQTHTFRQKEKQEPHDPVVRPNNRWPVIETYTRAPKRYAVSTTHFPNGFNVANNWVTGAIRDNFPWAITWSSTNSEQSSFRITQNWSGDPWPDVGTPMNSPLETVFGNEGVVVAVYELTGETNQFIEGFIPDQIQAATTSGNWRFMHLGTCMIGVYFTAGFSIQPAKDIFAAIQHAGISRSAQWLRSPGSGSATRLGIVVETAAPEDYAGGDAATQLSNFQSAVTASRGGFPGGVDASQIGASQPQITYHALNGKSYVCQYMGLKSIDGVPFDWDNAKRVESPWVTQDYGGDDMFVTDPGTGQVTRYRWSDKSITQL